MSPGNALVDQLFEIYDNELVIRDADGVKVLARYELKEKEMQSEQGLTPYRENLYLVDENAQLRRTVNELTLRLEKGAEVENEVAKARLAIHASSSLFVYAVGAAIAGGPMLEHPHLFSVVASLNLLIWTVGSAFRRFGT